MQITIPLWLVYLIGGSLGAAFVIILLAYAITGYVISDALVRYRR